MTLEITISESLPTSELVFLQNDKDNRHQCRQCLAIYPSPRVCCNVLTPPLFTGVVVTNLG